MVRCTVYAVPESVPAIGTKGVAHRRVPLASRFNAASGTPCQSESSQRG